MKNHANHEKITHENLFQFFFPLLVVDLLTDAPGNTHSRKLTHPLVLKDTLLNINFYFVSLSSNDASKIYLRHLPVIVWQITV